VYRVQWYGCNIVIQGLLLSYAQVQYVSYRTSYFQVQHWWLRYVWQTNHSCNITQSQPTLQITCIYYTQTKTHTHTHSCMSNSLVHSLLLNIYTITYESSESSNNAESTRACYAQYTEWYSPRPSSTNGYSTGYRRLSWLMKLQPGMNIANTHHIQPTAEVLHRVQEKSGTLDF